MVLDEAAQAQRLTPSAGPTDTRPMLATGTTEGGDGLRTAVPGVRERLRFQRTLLAIVLVGLAARLAVVTAIPTRPTSDSWSYLQRGLNLLHHGRYEPLPGAPDATYPPGYSLLLAAVAAAVPDEATVLGAKLASCLLACASIWLCGLLAERAFGARAGLLAAALLACYPRHVLQAAVLLSEHLFLPLLLLFVLALVSARDHPRPWRLALAAGVTAGLLTLVRPIGYLLPLAWLWHLVGRRDARRRVVGELAVLVAVQHLVLLPWAARNLRSLGTFSFLSSAGGVDLFIGNNPHATGGWAEWRAALAEMEPAASRPGLGCFEVDALARRAALRWMREQPAATLGMYARKLGLILAREDYLTTFALTGRGLWPPFGGASALPEGHPALALAPAAQRLMDVAYWLLLGLAAAACVLEVRREWRSGSRARWPGWLLLGGAAYFPLVAAVFLASSRFRWPAEELLVPVAACGLLALASLRSR